MAWMVSWHLDPRVVIIRHEVLPSPAPLPAATGPIKVVAALASGDNLPLLDLETEKSDLQEAFGEQDWHRSCDPGGCHPG